MVKLSKLQTSFASCIRRSAARLASAYQDSAVPGSTRRAGMQAQKRELQVPWVHMQL